jgi:hypothetical protein
LNEKGKRATSIYLAVSDDLKNIPDAKKTDLIAQQAQEHSISYETARASYYDVKKIVGQNKKEWPAKYINKDV